MFRNALLILLLILQRCSSSIEEHKERFIFFEDYPLNDTIDCLPITKEFYLNVRNDNETFVTKLACLPENLELKNYFPKCCPPDRIYERKNHKCIASNSTNIQDDFGEGNLLIRTDLSDCKVILDHVFDNQSNFLINSDRSLEFQNKIYKLGSYCLDNAYGDGNLVVLRTCENVNVCKEEGVRCIKKCCPDGQYYKGSTCQSGHDFGVSNENITRYVNRDEHFNAVLISDTCPRYMDKPNIKLQINEDGSTVIREFGIWKHYAIDEACHCIEYVQRAKDYKLLLCKIPPLAYDPVKDLIRQITLCVSCFCLLLTLVGYLLIPDLKNLIGRIITCYCSCLLIAFALLTYAQFESLPGDYCDAFGFIIAFFFLAAFSWMTIMSYEMWRVLGSMTAQYGGKTHTHNKRFILYNVFGWSIPICIITFTLFDYLYYFLPNYLHISVGFAGCVFDNTSKSSPVYGYIFHFASPCGIYLLTNLVIFVKTIRYIYHVKNEIQAIKIQDGHEKRKKWMILNTDKERLKMVIKIFLVMGVNWLFEVFSSIVYLGGDRALEIVELVLDTFNGLQGVFIFCIFLLKKKIWKSLRVQLNLTGSRSSVVTCSTEEMMIRH